MRACPRRMSKPNEARHVMLAADIALVWRLTHNTNKEETPAHTNGAEAGVEEARSKRRMPWVRANTSSRCHTECLAARVYI